MLRRAFLSTPLLLAQDGATIRVDVNLVNVPFSARNERGEWVKDLRSEDVEAYEDGVRQQIRFFSRAGESPLSLALVADSSGSQEDFLKDHRRDLRDFLKAVLRPSDQAMLVAFRRTIRVVSPFGKIADKIDDDLKDYQKAKNANAFRELGGDEIRDGASPVYDAVTQTVKELSIHDGRRAIVLFSDGEETSSSVNLMDTIEAAQAAGVTLITVRYTDLRKGRQWTARDKYGRSVMTRMARETGGLDIDATGADDLRPLFHQIGDMLRNSYDLGYASSQGERDGTFRKLRLKPVRPGIVLRHKTGYYARVD
jgi:Ca-activated chloride channel homolog